MNLRELPAVLGPNLFRPHQHHPEVLHRPSDDRVKPRPWNQNPEHCSIVIDQQTEDWEIVGAWSSTQ